LPETKRVDRDDVRHEQRQEFRLAAPPRRRLLAPDAVSAALHAIVWRRSPSPVPRHCLSMAVAMTSMPRRESTPTPDAERKL
jgi:hypothetical protein